MYDFELLLISKFDYVSTPWTVSDATIKHELNCVVSELTIRGISIHHNRSWIGHICFIGQFAVHYISYVDRGHTSVGIVCIEVTTYLNDVDELRL